MTRGTAGDALEPAPGDGRPRPVLRPVTWCPSSRRRGIHLSRQYVHRLVTKAPQRVNIDLLAALCDALDCGPSDLLEPVVEADDTCGGGIG